MGYSFRSAARVLLYASSHRQDNTYHGLCYTSRGAVQKSEARYNARSSFWEPSDSLLLSPEYIFIVCHYGKGHVIFMYLCMPFMFTLKDHWT